MRSLFLVAILLCATPALAQPLVNAGDNPVDSEEPQAASDGVDDLRFGFGSTGFGSTGFGGTGFGGTGFGGTGFGGTGFGGTGFGSTGFGSAELDKAEGELEGASPEHPPRTAAEQAGAEASTDTSASGALSDGDLSEEATPESDAPPATEPAPLPATIAAAIVADPFWSSGYCSDDQLATTDVKSVDLNGDGVLEYIVWDPCDFGANNGQVDVYSASGDTYRVVLSYYGFALEPRGAQTGGYFEMLGQACDGMSDCERVYFRWNGTEFERYRLERWSAL